jgi:hypothetical protein
MRRTARWRDSLVVLICTVGVATGWTTASGQEFILNGDFQQDIDQWVAWPGYVNGTNENGTNPPEISEWFHMGGVGINPVMPGANENPSAITGFGGAGGRGINPVAPGGANDAPFRDNGDNDTTVAFLQGTSSLVKEISGLTIGGNYTLSLDYNARNCCGDFPVPELSINGMVVPNFPDPDLNPDGVVLPVGDFNPWYFSEIEFTADSSDLSILITTRPELGGDATFLVDNLELILAGTGENLIENGDFEADADAFGVWPGYVGDDTSRAPFRDNGNNRTAIAFMQGDARLEQDLSGLTPGQEYTLSFDYNARNCCGDAIPLAEVEIDGVALDNFPPEEQLDGIEPVGGLNDWYHFETTIIPDRSTLTLSFHAFPAFGGDATFVLDNVSFRPATAATPGDFNGDGVLDAQDIDALTAEAAGGLNDPQYDLNNDSMVNVDDINVWIKDLFNSWVGDANLDNQFNSADLVEVLASGTYENDVAAVWSTGDFDGDGRTNSSDLVAALADGGYELGPRAALQAVPEPSTALLASLACGPLVARSRRRKP